MLGFMVGEWPGHSGYIVDSSIDGNIDAKTIKLKLKTVVEDDILRLSCTRETK